ncbi:unnamed protein product, partial [Ectocarpus sp. 6 AP-2014]
DRRAAIVQHLGNISVKARSSVSREIVHAGETKRVFPAHCLAESSYPVKGHILWTPVITFRYLFYAQGPAFFCVLSAFPLVML